MGEREIERVEMVKKERKKERNEQMKLIVGEVFRFNCFIASCCDAKQGEGVIDQHELGHFENR